MNDPGTIPAATLADLVGVTPKFLAKLAKQGRIPHPKAGRYPTGSALRALFTFYRELAHAREEKTRETKARADILELKRSLADKSLVSLDDAKKVCLEILAPLREQLLALPSAIASRCNHQDPARARRALTKAINHILKSTQQ